MSYTKQSKFKYAFLFSSLLVVILLALNWILNREQITNLMIDNDSIYRPSQTSIKQQPLGEITSGFFISQQMKNLDIQLNDLSQKQSEVCLNLFLANYSNRRNLGKMQVTVFIDKFEKSARVDYSQVKDNTFHTSICLDSDDLTQVSNREGKIPNGKFTIKGIEGESGSSITAWLTHDTQYGVASINNVRTDKAIIYSLTLHNEQRTIRWRYVIAISLLGIVYIATISTLALLF